MAVVFITRVDDGESKQEGICIKCAKELGIKPVNDIISKMGLSDEDVDRMSEEMQDIMDGIANGEDPLGVGGGEGLVLSGEDESRAPAVDFGKLMREGLAAAGLPQENKPAKEKGRTGEKGEARKKRSASFSLLIVRILQKKLLWADWIR